MAGVAAQLRPVGGVEATQALAGGVGGVVEEHEQVAEHVQRGRAVGRPSAARTSARIDAASPVGPSRPVPSGVTNTTSALRAASRYAVSTCASAVTTGWPCGGRGVIDGPRTEKCAPSKSM